MGKRFNLSLIVDCNLSYFFDDTSIYKSDRFFKETRYALGVDFALERISGVIRKNIKEIENLSGHGDGFAVRALDNVLYFDFSHENAQNDIVFYDFQGKEIHKNDRRFLNLLKNNFEISIYKTKIESTSFNKLYSLSFADGVNFPLLNKKQQEIVYLEEGNVLVQGVAGSGKTNICIDKIIFAACKGYKGKLLYSTYSRGLLIETQNKVNVFISILKTFVSDYLNGKIITNGDFNHCIKKHLGLNVDISNDNVVEVVNGIVSFLENNVDYLLLTDIYKKVKNEEFSIANENTFKDEYLKNLKNYHIQSALEKIKYLGIDIIYKEIYGMIFGSSDEKLNVGQYISKREGSFSKFECGTIFDIAQDYSNFLYKNGYVDNNIVSRLLLNYDFDLYSLIILDEVQDFTEINLKLFKKMSMKMFCVGDALQMINPSYFSFAFLKRLLYEKDVTEVRELVHNYRNTEKLEFVIEKLNEINIDRFGTHSFVLKGESVEGSVDSVIEYTKDIVPYLNKVDLSNITLVCGSQDKKEELRKSFEKAEILTVSEIKGLERESVLLIDILSDNIGKWEKLYKDKINRKTADENSAYRYWLNLFYVGASRARRNLFVSEKKDVSLFNDFFKDNFISCAAQVCAKDIENTIGIGKLDEDVILERINEFINLSQFDNAITATKSLSDEEETKKQLDRIEIYREYVSLGKYNEAGIAFWEKGILDEAKKFFNLANNSALSDLVDACSGKNSELNASIVSFYDDLKGNETARNLILDTLKKETNKIKEESQNIKERLKKYRNKK